MLKMNKHNYKLNCQCNGPSMAKVNYFFCILFLKLLFEKIHSCKAQIKQLY